MRFAAARWTWRSPASAHRSKRPWLPVNERQKRLKCSVRNDSFRGFQVYDANGFVVRRQRKLKLHRQTAWPLHAVNALLVADVRNPTAFEVFRCRGGVELGKLLSHAGLPRCPDPVWKRSPKRLSNSLCGIGWQRSAFDDGDDIDRHFVATGQGQRENRKKRENLSSGHLGRFGFVHLR